MNEKTVLITGATGYFGGIAVQYFKDKGWNTLKAGRQEGNDIILNLDKPEDIAGLKVEQKVDLLIHAAAANEVLCNQNPYNSVFNNVVGTRAILDFCVNNEIDKMVYISTFHVYGNPIGIIDENVIPLPSNDYGLSHLQAEEYIQMYRRAGKIKGMIVRPSNLYGVPGDVNNCNRWSLVTLGFIRDALRNGKIELKTSGTQERNFISAVDVCKFIDKAVPQIEKYAVVNLAGNETISIRNFALLIQEIAKEHFGIHIEVLLPNMTTSLQVANEFEYKSCHAKKIWQPSENITGYLINMFKILSNANIAND